MFDVFYPLGRLDLKMKLRLFLCSIFVLSITYVLAVSSQESNAGKTTKGRATRARRILFGNVFFLLAYIAMIYWWEVHGRFICRDTRLPAQSASTTAFNLEPSTNTNAQYTGVSTNEYDAVLNIQVHPNQPKHSARKQLLSKVCFVLRILRPIALTLVILLTSVSFWTNMFWCDREATWLGVISYACFYLFLQLCVLLVYLIGTYLIVRLARLPTRCPKVPWATVRLVPILLYLVVTTPLAFYYGSIGPRVVEVPLRFKPGLIPEQFDGFRIAQLSDIHIGTPMPLRLYAQCI